MKKNKRVNKKKAQKVASSKANSFFTMLVDNFVFSFKDVNKKRNFIFLALGLFLLFALIGYFFPIFFVDSIMKTIAEIVKKTEGLGPIELISYIMINNIKSSFFGLVFGVFLGIVPLGVIIFNGYLLGFVASKTVAIAGPLVLWRLLPHGIFEIPAILISIGYGIRLGFFPMYLKEKGRGFLSIVAMIGSFLLFTSIFYFIFFFIFLASNQFNFQSSTQFENFYLDALNNPIIGILFFVVYGLSFVASVFVGLRTLSVKDKKITVGIMKDSLEIFLFVVIPLLIVAAIIEGLLINFL